MPTSFRTTIPSDKAAPAQTELARVCGEVAAIHRRAWGRGPVKATAHWAGRNMLVVLLQNGLTGAEQTLRATGHTQPLLAHRRLLDHIVADELTSSVERITGRHVQTMLSATRLEPDLTAELFLLASAHEPTRGVNDPAETDTRTQEPANEARAFEARQCEARQSIQQAMVRAHEFDPGARTPSAT